MTSFKRQVQKIVGYDENAPRSVDTVDWVKSHKGDIKQDVSGLERFREWLLIPGAHVRP
jgi:hypothetical protein